MNRPDQILSIAKSYIGSCACKPFRNSFIYALGNIEGITDPLNQLDLARPFAIINNKVQGISCCGMFALNVYNIAGIINQKWHIGNGLGIFEAWGRANNCWVEWNKDCDELPMPGDLLIMGINEGSHACIVEFCDGKTITTINGGSNCYSEDEWHEKIGLQCIKLKKQDWNSIIKEGWISIEKYNH